jgi:hypothetical protein
MKRTYEEAELDIITMNSNDVIVTSLRDGEELSIDPIEL